jgi:F-type H+-transporting ATPase subunit a
MVIFRRFGETYSKKWRNASGVGRIFEPVVLFIRDEIAIPNIGEKHTRDMSYLLTIFFVLFLNILD